MFNLTVGLLETRTGTPSSVLFGFAPTWVRDKKVAVVCQESLPEFILAVLINIFGVVSNDTLGNSGTDGVNLSGDTSTLYSDANINVGKFVLSKDKNGFVNFVTKGLWFDVFDGLPINFDKTASLLCECTCGSSLFSTEGGLFSIN